MKTKLIALVMFAGLLLGLARGVAAAPLDTRIPSDAIIYVGWQGADALAPAYAQSNLKGFIESSKLGDYVTKQWPNWMAMVSGGDPEALKQLDDILLASKLMSRHPMALYIGPMEFANPRTAPKFKLAWLCDAGEDVANIEQFFKNLTEKNPAPPDMNFKCTRDGSTVIVTIGEATAEMFSPFLNWEKATAREKVTRLAGSTEFAAATRGMRPDAALTVYVDVEKIMAMVDDGMTNMGAPPQIRTQAAAIYSAIGFSSLTQLAYTAGFDKKEWVDNAFIGMKGDRVGLLSVLNAAPITDDVLLMIPKDAVGFNAARIDFVKILAEIRTIAGEITHGDSAIDDALAHATEELGVDLEKDLIDSLGDQWVLYRGARGQDMASHPIVFVQKLRNAAGMQKSLDVLAAKIKEGTNGAFKVEKLDTGTITVSGIRFPMITVAWTIRGDYLYVSNLEGISPAIDQVEKKMPCIRENPTFLAVLKSLPQQKPMALSFGEPAKLYPDLYQAITVNLLPMAKLAGVDIPGNLIPAPQRIAPFLTPGGSIAWTDADGFHLSGRSALPGAEIFAGQPSLTASVPAFMAGVLMPSMGKSRVLANRSADAANLRGIVNSCIIYAAQNNDAFPDDVAKLLDPDVAGMSPKLLVSKRAGTTPLVMTDEMQKLVKDDFAAFSKKVEEHCDFVYLGKDRKNDTDASMVLAYEKPGPKMTDGINIAYDDCHVDFVRYSGLKDAFAATNKYLKENKLPEIDVDALLQCAPGHH